MKPLLRGGGITLFHGDMREITPTLNFADLITITDPPYGRTTSLEWDHWVDGWPALIGGETLWCFGSMRMFMERVGDFTMWKFGQDIVWQKHNGSSFATDRFRRLHESAVHFFRGPWSEVSHETPVTMDAVRKTVPRRKGKPQHLGQIGDTVPYQSIDGGPRLMTSVIPVRSCHGDAVHPTQKPIGILDPLIRYSTPVGWSVFDPFAGSGSTLVAAKLAGRGAVGIEKSEAFCEAAALRLDQGVLALEFDA